MLHLKEQKSLRKDKIKIHMRITKILTKNCLVIIAIDMYKAKKALKRSINRSNKILFILDKLIKKFVKIIILSLLKKYH